MKSKKVFKIKVFPKQEEWNSLRGHIHCLGWIKFNFYTNRTISRIYHTKTDKLTLRTLKWDRGRHKDKYRYHVTLKKFNSLDLNEIKDRLSNVIRILRLKGDEVTSVTAYAQASFLYHLKGESRDSIFYKLKNSNSVFVPSARVTLGRKGKKKVFVIAQLGGRADRVSIQARRQQIKSRFRKLPNVFRNMLVMFKEAGIEVVSRSMGEYLDSIERKERKIFYGLVIQRMKNVLLSLDEKDKSIFEIYKELKESSNYDQVRYVLRVLEKEKQHRSLKYTSKLVESRRERKKGQKGVDQRIFSLTEAGKREVRRIRETMKNEGKQQSWASLGVLNIKDVEDVLK